MNRSELIHYLDDYLRIAEIKDYGPQGLQLEATQDEIKRVALAVDVSPAIIREAAAWPADLLLVHHGILWRSVERIAGSLGQRVRLLLQHDMNLYAAHLPLDAHPEVGNNAVLAEMFGITIEEWWCAPTGTPLGVAGQAAAGLTLAQLTQAVNEKLHTQARVLPYGPEVVNKVAIVSGFGADKIEEAQALGVDTYLTGETSHANYWAASDYQINIIYAGHYATETVGVQALGRHLSQKFGLETKFFDFPTDM